ncbi:MAG: hypothetical protein HDT02_05805 [Bacteroidales bacterium]|nr:hypothetical protein [Bacteroidales bacterium]
MIDNGDGAFSVAVIISPPYFTGCGHTNRHLSANCGNVTIPRMGQPARIAERGDGGDCVF